jgi:hypothetical protein
MFWVIGYFALNLTAMVIVSITMYCSMHHDRSLAGYFKETFNFKTYWISGLELRSEEDGPLFDKRKLKNWVLAFFFFVPAMIVGILYQEVIEKVIR